MPLNLSKFILVIFSFVTVHLFAQTPNTWTQKANFGGVGISQGVGFSIGGKGYIGAGYNNASNTYYNDLWEYDPAANTWSQKATMPGAARANGVGFSIGSKGYAGMGGTGPGGATYLSDFYEYDPTTNTWTTKASFPTVRQRPVGFSIGPKGYVGLGVSNTSGLNSDFWEYDPAINQWTQKASFIGAGRQGAYGMGIGNQGYVGLGFIGAANAVDFYKYDPVANTWTQKANFTGVARQLVAGFAIAGKGYIGTGTGTIGTFIYNDFFEYDTLTNSWTQRANYGGGVDQTAVGFSIGNKGYIGTGILPNAFWEYTPAVTIATGLINGSPFCSGVNVSVTFTATGILNSGNVFTAQLSNSSGSFSNPVNIGSVAGTASGTIFSTIPASTITSPNYRIRVISSSPADTGTDNGIDLSINAATPPLITINTPVTSFCSGYPVTFTSMISNGGSAPGYQWQKNNVNIAGATSSSYSLLNAAGGDVVRCILTSSGGSCIFPLKDTSNAISLSIFPSNLNITPPLANLCAGDSAILYADTSTLGLTYQWQVNNNNIPGATSSHITVKTAGSYHVNLSAGNCNASSNLVPVNVYALPTPSLHVNGNYLFTDNFTTYQWNLNSVAISGATNLGYNAPSGGHYSVTVSDLHGCNATTGIYPLEVSILSGNQIQFFPNPATQQLTITGLKSKTNWIAIIDPAGREVFRSNLDQRGDVKFKHLATGLYFVKIWDEVGLILSEKLLID